MAPKKAMIVPVYVNTWMVIISSLSDSTFCGLIMRDAILRHAVASNKDNMMCVYMVLPRYDVCGSIMHTRKYINCRMGHKNPTNASMRESLNFLSMLLIIRITVVMTPPMMPMTMESIITHYKSRKA